MADTGPAPPTKPPVSRGEGRALAAGCGTLVLGLVVSWTLAQYAMRQMPARTEVFEALYWDVLWLKWGCGGSIVSAVLAVIVGVWVAARSSSHRA